MVDMKKSVRSINIVKCIVSVIWLLIVVAVVSPSQLPFPEVFYGIAAFFVVSHVYVIVKFRKFMRGLSDYPGVYLFGLLQLWTIRR
jgi:uncharacterized protein YhhL (DUF1145 family)